MSRLIRSVVLALVAVLTALIVAGCTGKDAVDQSSAGNFRFVTATQVGHVYAEADRKSVGAVTGTLIGGGSYSLAAARGKVVVINFWATWCGPCKTETPQLDALYRQLGPQDYSFIGIDIKELSRDAATS